MQFDHFKFRLPDKLAAELYTEDKYSNSKFSPKNHDGEQGKSCHSNVMLIYGLLL